MRPIDADALMKELEELREAYRNDHDDDGYYATEDFGCLVRNAPTIDVRPVVHGHWEDVVIAGNKGTMCSACGNSGFNFFSYCPHCGAIMDEKEEL